jgi:acid phosphatase
VLTPEAVTHPSEPNYAAVVGGDTFGMDNDDFITFPSNISTVVDLLDTKGISWAGYQEHIPYPGYAGFNFSNQNTFANDYVRKHNQLVLYQSVSDNSTRAAQIKSFVNLTSDITNKKLAQWSFVTPNMTNDGHDTNITFAASWARAFLEPLLEDDYTTQNTLFVLSFDENEDYPTPNRVYTVLLGGAVDESLHGTTDDTFYTHYSMISTVSANWDLPSLGRWDCGANILALVANKTGYHNAAVPHLDRLAFNASYPGPVSDAAFTPGWWPAPNTQARCSSGNGVLQAVADTWGSNQAGTYDYTNVYPYDAVSGIATGADLVTDANDAGSSGGSGTGSSGTGTSSSPSPSSSHNAAAGPVRVGAMGGVVVGALGLVAAVLL